MSSQEEKKDTASKQTASKQESKKPPAKKEDSTEAAANPDQPQKSKADLRREKAAIQEAQRAKKAAALEAKKASQPPPKGGQPAKPQAAQVSKPSVPQSSVAPSTPTLKSAVTADPSQYETAAVTLVLNKKSNESSPPRPGAASSGGQVAKAKLFHHFEQYQRDYSITETLNVDHPSIHPAFVRLGLHLAHETITGSNSRCTAFLNAFRVFLHDYKAPSANKKKTMGEDLMSKLKPNINFLAKCRPLSISMGNAIKEIKLIISRFPPDITEKDAKQALEEEIELHIHEKIVLAGETITKYILAHSEIVISGMSYSRSKIADKDCLLTYGYSSLVLNILLQARQKFPNIHVVVVDSRPRLKGKQMLEQLVKNDIRCTYMLINAVSFIMNRVSKVIIGAHALLANGYVMSPIGTSQIALVAKSFNVPVVVCCETYKFCDKVQTDALVNNELGNPYDLIESSATIKSGRLIDEKSPLTDLSDGLVSNDNLTLLNLTYDVTPPDFVTCVVTELGMLPCTSVPVVLRLKNRDNYYVGSGGHHSGGGAASKKELADEEIEATDNN